MIGCLEVGLGYVLLFPLRWQQEEGLLMTAWLLCIAYLHYGFQSASAYACAVLADRILALAHVHLFLIAVDRCPKILKLNCSKNAALAGLALTRVVLRKI